WDLVGAGLGALVIVPLLRFPAPVLLVALGVVACGAAALFAGPSAARMLRRRIGTIAGAGVALIAVAAVIPVLYLPMPPVQRDDLLVDTWHPLSRVQALQLPGAPGGLVFYDRVYAPVPHVSGAHLPDWRDLLLGPASIGYQLTGPGHALVIGGGGGRDIYNALTSGQKVDVIELNSAIVHAADASPGPVSGPSH